MKIIVQETEETQELDMGYASLVREAPAIYQAQTQTHVCEATYHPADGWQPCCCTD